MTADPSGMKGFSAPSLYSGAHAVVQNFKENQRDASHCSSLLEFHGLCRAQIHHPAHVTLVIVSDFCFLFCFFFFLSASGGPHFNGATEEYGCCRRRLLSAVRGAADVAGRDDGDVLTRCVPE